MNDQPSFDIGADAGDGDARAEVERPVPAEAYLASKILVAINVLIFILMSVSTASLMSPGTSELINWGANFGPLTMSGQPWRLLSSLFIHIGIIHILLNMFVLWSTGPQVEAAFGTARFLLLYFLAGLGGSVVSICWSPGRISAGASGAIFGLVGGLLGFLVRNKDKLGSDVFSGQLKNLLAFVGYNVIYGLTNPRIDNSAHMGGLITGIATGLVLSPGGLRNSRIRAGEWMGIIVIATALVFGSFIGSAKARSPENVALARMLTLESVPAGNATIQYSPEIPRETISALGAELETLGYTKARSTILLIKNGDAIELGFVVRDGTWSQSSIVSSFRVIGAQVSKNVFSGKAIDVGLYDKQMVLQKTVHLAEKF